MSIFMSIAFSAILGVAGGIAVAIIGATLYRGIAHCMEKVMNTEMTEIRA